MIGGAELGQECEFNANRPKPNRNRRLVLMLYEFDHKKQLSRYQAFRYSGQGYRLTDVGGHVVDDLLA